jgi:hypothetical protein
MTAETQEAAKEEPLKCRDVKYGPVELYCELDAGHAEGPDGTWHEATFRDHREIAYSGSRHVVDTVEHVTWEPVDHAAEAVRHLTAGMKRKKS